MGSHRYWRIFVRASAPANTFAAFAEIEFRETISGANVALSGNGVASADSSFNGTYIPSAAIDGNAATLWESGATLHPHWWTFYFDTARDIAELSIKATPSWPDEAPRVFDLQWSDDGLSWVTRFAISDSATVWTGGQTRVFNASSTGASTPPSYPASPQGYWRVYVSRGFHTNYLALSTVAMAESAAGSNVSVTANGTASADSEYSGAQLASYAADGNSSTYWESGSGYPHWWAFAFSVSRSIREISLTNAAAWSTESPKITDVQYSADGVTWLTAWMVVDPAAVWGTPSTHTYTLPEETATVTGTAAGTLDALTSTGAGEVIVPTGTAAGTLDALTSAASGTHAEPITGTASPILEDLASAGAGTHAEPITGTGASTLVALYSTTVPPNTGTASSTLGDATSAGTGGSHEAITGLINSHLSPVTSAGAGLSFEPSSGLSAVTLEALVSAGTGHHRFGTSAATLEALAGSGVGSYLVTGIASGALVDLASYGFGTAYMARRVRQLALTGSTKPTKALNGTMRI